MDFQHELGYGPNVLFNSCFTFAIVAKVKEDIVKENLIKSRANQGKPETLEG